MNIPVYNIERKKTEEMSVPSRIFDTPWKPELVHQAIVTQQSNSRQKTALVKNRGEVRGGGKKPWKQKGTGRARHGSIRSPLWIGGGVTHGPTAERTFEKKINKKMKTTALFSLLSKRFSDGNLIVMDGFSSEEIKKSKDIFTKIKGLMIEFKTIGIVTSSKDKNIFLASRNVNKLNCTSAKSLNVVDVSWPNELIITKQAIPEIISNFLEKKNKKEIETEK